MFQTLLKSTALYFMHPRSVQLVARNWSSLLWRHDILAYHRI